MVDKDEVWSEGFFLEHTFQEFGKGPQQAQVSHQSKSNIEHL